MRLIDSDRQTIEDQARATRLCLEHEGNTNTSCPERNRRRGVERHARVVHGRGWGTWLLSSEYSVYQILLSVSVVQKAGCILGWKAPQDADDKVQPLRVYTN